MKKDLCVSWVIQKNWSNGKDIISIDVHDRVSTTTREFDTAVVRTDSLALGVLQRFFEGSPVLN